MFVFTTTANYYHYQYHLDSMVAKKGKSKRTSLKDKYKIKRRVAEHHRKARKMARKRIGTHKKKISKDPGIPNLWPYKEQMLKKIEETRERFEAKKEEASRQRRLLLARKRKELKRANRGMSGSELERMAQSAADRGNYFTELQKSQQQGVNTYTPAQAASAQDSSTNAASTRRAYYRELNKMMRDADVLLEVLDARDPLGCRAKGAERAFLGGAGVDGASKDRRIVLVLNKIDLVPPEVVQKWLHYFRREYPCVAFKASTQTQGHIGQASKATARKQGDLSTSLCVGADTLLQLLKNYSCCHNMKKAITVGIMGYPNVGKSSLINSLKRSRAVGVSSQPGFTKVTQEVQLDKKVKLIDCPGVIFSSDSDDASGLLLRNCISVDALEDPLPSAEAIIGRCRPDQLMSQYSVPRFNSAGEFLYMLAQQQGKLKRGGVPDKERAARNLVQDWNTGKIPFFTLPPEEAPKSDAVVLAQYSKEFNLDEVFANEVKVIKELPEMDQDDFMALAPSKAPAGRERGWSSEMVDDDAEMEDGSSGAPFVAATSFSGERPGYVFQMGDMGLGYYRQA